MGQRKRMRRPEPQRIAPQRHFRNVVRDSAAADLGWQETLLRTADFNSRAVEESVRRCWNVTQCMRGVIEDPRHADHELLQIVERMLRYGADLVTSGSCLPRTR